jgi:Uma2 family endonuclease
MPRPTATPPPWTVAGLAQRFGPIDVARIRQDPPPGQATEQDVIDIHDREDRLYELVDGILVEKVMGFLESALACWIAHLLQNFLDRHDLGFLVGADGTVRLLPRLVRIPDVSFVSWDRLPKREVPTDPIPDLAPDLAVEVLSEGNTEKEMKRKLKDYFLAGVRLVWYVDPPSRTVSVYTAPDRRTRLTEEQTLTGGDVLPGLTVPLREVFGRVPPLEPRSARPKAHRPEPRGRPRTKKR